MNRRVAIRPGGASLRVDLRLAAVTAALAARVLLAVAASVALGEFALPLADVVRSLVGAGDRATNYIVLELRLPRALTGLLVGRRASGSRARPSRTSRATRSSRPTWSASPAAPRWRR